MSDRRRFLKGLTSLPLATVLANPRLAAAVSAGLQEVEAKLADGTTIKVALSTPQGQAKGSILLVHEWWCVSADEVCLLLPTRAGAARGELEQHVVQQQIG